MSEYDPQMPTGLDDPGHDHELDADVVCQDCGLVNEPGTLMCKQCGRNLRDQKRERLAHAQVEAAPSGINRRQILSGMFSVLGILIVIFVAINADSIVEGFPDDNDPGKNAQVFWTGQPATIFNEMAESLRSYPPTEEDIQEAIYTTANADTIEGRYVIRPEAAVQGAYSGIAEVRIQNGQVYYVALMNSGWEIRGIGTIDSDVRISSADAAGTIDGQYRTGVGYVQRNDQQYFTIIGIGNESNTQFRYAAHVIPY